MGRLTPYSHGGEDQQDGEVNPDGGVEVVLFEVVGEVAHEEGDHGGQADSQHESQQVPLEQQLQAHPPPQCTSPSWS